jgi:hypothetical protein
MTVRTQRANVTTLKPVTVVRAVTPETLAPQPLSSLSPLSLLLFLAIHGRDKGLGPTSVTGDDGDTADILGSQARGFRLTWAAPCDRWSSCIRTETKKPKKVAHDDF